MTDYRVLDKTKAHEKSYISVVFRRNDRLKDDISLSKWIWLTLIELIVGFELIESIVTTASVPPYGKNQIEDSGKYGAELHLTHHIPSGLITNLLRSQIIELLYYKFYYQYLLLSLVGEPYIDDTAHTIDCTRTMFRARKEIFYQLIALRRVYDLSWLVFNLFIDLLVYYLSSSLEWALVSALTIEGVRRLLKV